MPPERNDTWNLHKLELSFLQIPYVHVHTAHEHITVQARTTVFYTVRPEVEILLLHSKPRKELVYDAVSPKIQWLLLLYKPRGKAV